LINLIALE